MKYIIAFVALIATGGIALAQFFPLGLVSSGPPPAFTFPYNVNVAGPFQTAGTPPFQIGVP